MSPERHVDSEPTSGNPIRLVEIQGPRLATFFNGQMKLSEYGIPTSIDFEGVKEATYSFLDAYVGQAAQIAIGKGRQLPELLNVPERIRGPLEQVFEHRGIKCKLPRRGA